MNSRRVIKIKNCVEKQMRLKQLFGLTIVFLYFVLLDYYLTNDIIRINKAKVREWL